MDEYFRAKLSEAKLALSKTLNENEFDRIYKSDNHWASKKLSPDRDRTNIKKGDVYQFEFGKNYIPEMSYEHRGLVIRTIGKLLYVLPICSYSDKYKDAKIYHERDCPHGDYMLLKAEDYNFIDHDSVLKINDLRAVSVRRIKYSQKGGFDINSDVYKLIERLVFEKIFPNYSHELNKQMSEIQDLKKQVEELTIHNTELEENLAKAMEELKKSDT